MKLQLYVGVAAGQPRATAFDERPWAVGPLRELPRTFQHEPCVHHPVVGVPVEAYGREAGAWVVLNASRWVVHGTAAVGKQGANNHPAPSTFGSLTHVAVRPSLPKSDSTVLLGAMVKRPPCP